MVRSVTALLLCERPYGVLVGNFMMLFVTQLFVSSPVAGVVAQCQSSRNEVKLRVHIYLLISPRGRRLSFLVCFVFWNLQINFTLFLKLLCTRVCLFVLIPSVPLGFWQIVRCLEGLPRELSIRRFFGRSSTLHPPPAQSPRFSRSQVPCSGSPRTSSSSETS
jgi:hypothetical protein